MASLKLLIISCCLVAACQAIAPLLNADLDTVIEGEYIVVLKPGSVSLATSADILKSYNFVGTRVFYLKADDAQLAQIRNDPNVMEVEANGWNYHADCTNQEVSAGLWGLARLSSRALGESSTFNYEEDDNGDNVFAYILDTGIFLEHQDFGDRAVYGFDAINESSPSDLHGHGTHVAGTVGGTEYGVAKNVQLVAVKVLGQSGSGTLSGIIDGINWVTSQQTAGQRSVMNMSLGASGQNAGIQAAVQAAYAAGVVSVVSAGNSNGSACNQSPAFIEEAITVGSTTNTDARSSFSNFGPCVDIFAPGSNVLSAWIGSPTATNTISGTSMAAPHVAGWVARFQSGQTTAPSPAQVLAALEATGTPDLVTDPGTGSPNLLPFTSC